MSDPRAGGDEARGREAIMALGDCLDLRRAFEKADAELGAAIDRLIPIGELGNESGRVVNDAALSQLAELARVRREAWDAYMECVKRSRR